VAAALFSESAGRAIVSVAPGRDDEFAALCEAHGVPATVLGLTGGDALAVDGNFEIPLSELERVWTATLPALFG
jgi:phosphoribosylformylglycinamidine synthase